MFLERIQQLLQDGNGLSTEDGRYLLDLLEDKEVQLRELYREIDGLEEENDFLQSLINEGSH